MESLDKGGSITRAAQINGFDWNLVDHVLLDMDGTLLDRHFDNYFFEEGLPQRYAEKYGLDFLEAQQKLLAMYRSVEGSLQWADLHYWTKTLDIDVVALTRELDSLIGFLPDAVEFLTFLRERGKRVSVVTNAHYTNLDIKTAKTGLDRYVDRIVHAFEVGCLKMHRQFWSTCREFIGFEPSRTLYIDDDEACLAAAHQYGITHLYHRSKSSSRLPPEPSHRFTSIETLRWLMGPG